MLPVQQTRSRIRNGSLGHFSRAHPGHFWRALKPLDGVATGGLATRGPGEQRPRQGARPGDRAWRRGPVERPYINAWRTWSPSCPSTGSRCPSSSSCSAACGPGWFAGAARRSCRAGSCSPEPRGYLEWLIGRSALGERAATGSPPRTPPTGCAILADDRKYLALAPQIVVGSGSANCGRSRSEFLTSGRRACGSDGPTRAQRCRRRRNAAPGSMSSRAISRRSCAGSC